jgi:hypothetical protein
VRLQPADGPPAEYGFHQLTEAELQEALLFRACSLLGCGFLNTKKLQTCPARVTGPGFDAIYEYVEDIHTFQRT